MFDRSVNKVVLIGNLGKDPEINHTQSGLTIANLALATTQSWKDKQTGEHKENAEWHRLSVFNRLAEMCGQYLKKGNKIYIEGSLKTRKWQAKDGSNRYSTEIIVSDIEVLDSKSNSNFSSEEQGYDSRPTVAVPVKVNNSLPTNPITYGSKPVNHQKNYEPTTFIDDIPF